jgi:hypothetical protein
MRNIFIILVALGLVGCAANTHWPARAPVSINTVSPICTGKQQCEAMWPDAHEALQLVTRMRIRISTDSRIETFAPIRVSTLGGTVTKYPVSDDRYQIRLQLECYRYTDCSDLRAMGTNLFNNMLNERTVK